jgi:hypothetical protein
MDSHLFPPSVVEKRCGTNAHTPAAHDRSPVRDQPDVAETKEADQTRAP